MCARSPCRCPRDDLPALILPGGPGFGQSSTCLRVSDKSFWGGRELRAAPRLSFAGAGVGEEKDYSAAWVGQRASVGRRRPWARASLGHIVVYPYVQGLLLLWSLWLPRQQQGPHRVRCEGGRRIEGWSGGGRDRSGVFAYDLLGLALILLAQLS